MRKIITLKKLIRLAAVLALIGMQAACSNMNSSFDCPNKAGVNCKSLDQVNGMVDSGQLRGRAAFSEPSEPVATAKVAVIADNMEFASYPLKTDFRPGQPLRYGETVQRIWIAPYEDTEGNYHQDSMMYTILKDGHWIGQPVKAIQVS
jgi:conjugal transfer pilus assembly protein TraV